MAVSNLFLPFPVSSFLICPRHVLGPFFLILKHLLFYQILKQRLFFTSKRIYPIQSPRLCSLFSSCYFLLHSPFLSEIFSLKRFYRHSSHRAIASPTYGAKVVNVPSSSFRKWSIVPYFKICEMYWFFTNVTLSSHSVPEIFSPYRFFDSFWAR